MLDLGLILMVIGVVLAAPILWIVGLVLVVVGVVRWLVLSAQYVAGQVLSRSGAPQSLTTVSQ